MTMLKTKEGSFDYCQEERSVSSRFHSWVVFELRGLLLHCELLVALEHHPQTSQG
ncbi:hypothetical protein LR48_Vigan327s000200 [Vigna angularis]|uniref:Uncharacterized protein n=1 Tax=Phaseolus angularis TaxID=3914 RepID=A0A0L9T9V5_PHAAN|nr:hypothetical protein LR48_Vigan327s000200 [Vigna angularis]